MSDKGIELTRRKVLGGLTAIGAAGAATGAGTMALFSDTESSSGNTVSAGTLNLTTGESTSLVGSATGLAPGESDTPRSVTLTNAGSITGSLDIDVTITGQNDSGGSNPANDTDVPADKFAKALEVTTLTYGGSDVSGQVTGTQSLDGGSTTYTSLYDLANNAHGSSESAQNDLINLDDPGSSGTDFKLQLTLRSEAGNDYQADGVEFEVDFILNQKDGQ